MLFLKSFSRSPLSCILIINFIFALSFPSIGQTEQTYEEKIEYHTKEFENPKNSLRERIKNLERAVNFSMSVDLNEAKELMRKGNAVADTTSNLFTKMVVSYLNGLILKQEGEYENAIKQFENTKAISEKGKKSGYYQSSEYEIGQCYRIMGDQEKAMHYYNKYLSHFQKEYEEGDTSRNTIRQISNGHNVMGICNDLTGNFKEAISHYEKAIAIDLKINNPDLYLRYGNLGVSNYYMGNLKKATDFFLQGAKGAEKIGDKYGAAGNYINMQSILLELEDYLDVIKYGEKAKKAALETGDQIKISQANSNIGSAYNLMKKYDEGYNAYTEGLEIAKKLKNPELQSDHLSGIASALKGKKEYAKAESYYKKAIEICKNENTLCSETPYRKLGGLYVTMEKFSEAVPLLETGIKTLKENEEYLILVDELPNLVAAYAGIKEFSKAFKAQSELITLQDSIFNKKKLREITQLESNYEFDKEKTVLAAQKEADDAILKAETAQSRTAALGVGALALLGFGFFFNARRKNKIIAAAKDQLEQLNRTKDRIFAIIGHDLRKPVVAFSGISETINYLVKKEDYSTLQQLGDEIEKDGFALQKLTDNLLNWALMQRDVMPHHPSQINLSEKAEEVALIFKNVARDKSIELVNAIPEGQTAFADPNALLTILVNLTDNAIKYTPEGGRVKITAEESNEGIQIRVSDTGIGMSEEQLQEVFLLQKDKSQKGTGGEKGTGLGLHLVNELVKLNGGEIAAKSAVGKGTTFKVLLPVEQLAAA